MVEITRMFWKKVFTSDGFLMGEINSAELDTTTWQVKSFYVVLTDEAIAKFKFKRPFLGKVIVCLPTNTISNVKDTAILNKTINEMLDLKECKE
jgi:sporulation protein YlmC with PRC-barrel domain